MSLNKITLTRASIIGLIASMIFVAAITVAADLYIPIKNWLAATHGHHWVGKGIWMIIFFAVFTIVSYPILNRNQDALSAKMIRMGGHIAIDASVIMTLFFVYEYFWK